MKYRHYWLAVVNLVLVFIAAGVAQDKSSSSPSPQAGITDDEQVVVVEKDEVSSLPKTGQEAVVEASVDDSTAELSPESTADGTDESEDTEKTTENSDTAGKEGNVESHVDFGSDEEVVAVIDDEAVEKNHKKEPPLDVSVNAKPLSKSVLVVGATGATGKHVVQMLLDDGQTVHVVARSKDKMLQLLKQNPNTDTLLTVTEGTVLDMSDGELASITANMDAIVSCLGHNLSFQGLFGHPRRLVSDTIQRLVKATTTTSTKLIVMGSDGVAHPDGQTDSVRSFSERILLVVLRYLLPPHTDNEETAAYVYSLKKESDMEWCVVRPTDLQESDKVSAYELYDKPKGSLFGSGIASKINVAHFMVQLITNDDIWSEWKMKMPVLYNKEEIDENTKQEL